MTLDTIMVMIAVTAMFATLAIVLGWADRQTNGQAKRARQLLRHRVGPGLECLRSAVLVSSARSTTLGQANFIGKVCTRASS